MAQQQRVLVTGANKGIGFATVREVLAGGEDRFVLLGSRSVKRGEAALQRLVENNPEFEGRVELIQIDVADDESVTSAAQTVKERYSESQPLYGVVNNAGIGLGSADMRKVLDVNTRGPKRVCDAFLPLIDPDVGRVVNVASASGPNFVNRCSKERQQLLTSPDVTWEEIEDLMEKCLQIDAEDGDFEAAGLGDGAAYGLSKACLNAYTIALAREHSNLVINSCTPGFIETDLTRPMAQKKGVDPEEMGMKPPREGTRSIRFLLFGEPKGTGWYFGSDAERSPMDRYRAPGDPPYRGD